MFLRPQGICSNPTADAGSQGRGPKLARWKFWSSLTSCPLSRGQGHRRDLAPLPFFCVIRPGTDNNGQGPTTADFESGGRSVKLLAFQVVAQRY